MPPSDILCITPADLFFPPPLDRLIYQMVKLQNQSSDVSVAFKVKTTAPKRYCVRPNTGIIPPNQSVDVQVLLNVSRDPPAMPAKCKDKFQVQWTAVQTPPANLKDLWTNVDETMVGKQRLRCYFESPPHQSAPSDPAGGDPTDPTEQVEEKNHSESDFSDGHTATPSLEQPPQLQPPQHQQQQQQHTQQQSTIEQQASGGDQPQGSAAASADATVQMLSGRIEELSVEGSKQGGSEVISELIERRQQHHLQQQHLQQQQQLLMRSQKPPISNEGLHQRPRAAAAAAQPSSSSSAAAVGASRTARGSVAAAPAAPTSSAPGGGAVAARSQLPLYLQQYLRLLIVAAIFFMLGRWSS